MNKKQAFIDYQDQIAKEIMDEIYPDEKEVQNGEKGIKTFCVIPLIKQLAKV